MLNKVSIMGRLVRDPELRRTQSGIAVTTMRIAVERDFKGQDGARQSDFFDVVAWRNTAEFVSRYFAKGRMIVVDGRLQTREWTDRDNNRRTSIEIVADNIYFGDSRRDGPSGEFNNAYGAAPGYGGSSGGYGSAPGYGGYASGSGYSSNSSGGYGSNPGFAPNSSGGYGSAPGYGGSSGGYGGYSSGYSSNSSGGYGSYGGYASSYGGYDSAPAADNAAASPADGPAAPANDNGAPADGAAPAEKPAPSGFAEMADDDGDLPF